MDGNKIAGELVRLAKKLVAVSALGKPSVIAEMLNSWKLYDMQTFESLVKAGVVKEDKRDKFVFWVGRVSIRAVSQGRGLYDMKWEVR